MTVTLSATEAAAALGISVRTLDRMGERGDLLPVQRTAGGLRRYDPDEVEAVRTGTAVPMCDWDTSAGHLLEHRPGPGRYLFAGARCRLERGHTEPVDEQGRVIHQPNAPQRAALTSDTPSR